MMRFRNLTQSPAGIFIYFIIFLQLFETNTAYDGEEEEAEVKESENEPEFSFKQAGFSEEELVYRYQHHHIWQRPLIDMVLDSAIPNLCNTTGLIQVNLTEECFSDMLHFTVTFLRLNGLDPNICGISLANIVGISNNSALDQMDASAKIPAGIMRGNFGWRGNLYQCLNINEALPGRQRPYEGGYCRVSPKITTGNSTLDLSKLPISQDICLPKSCSNKADAGFLLHVAKLELSDIKCYDADKKMIEWPGVVVIILLLFFLAISLVATVIDYVWYQEHKDSHFAKDIRVKMLLSYSFYTNVREIFQAKNRPGQIGAIQCMRCWSIMWILMGHVLSIVAVRGDNLADAQDTVVHDWTTMFIANAFFAVDTFFFMSGLLLGFMWFKDYKKNRRFAMSGGAWIMFYVHRIIRLSPPYYMVIAFNTWVMPYFTHRSANFFSYDLLVEKNPCRTKWWQDLLYINNIYDYKKAQCYVPAWYLATDFQIYIFAPAILIAFALKPMAGWILSASLVALSVLANFITIFHYHMPPFSLSPALGGAKDSKWDGDMNKYQLLIYSAAWIRFPVYLIGMMLGYVLQFNKRKIRIPMALNLAAWSLAFVGLLACILGVQPWTAGTYWSLFWRGFYSAFSKILWALCLSWMVFAGYYGHGGFIDQFMSWNIWIPLGKLTYCVYLIHPMLSLLFPSFTDFPLHWSGIPELFIRYCISVAVFSFIVSIFWSSTFEIATGKVEMLLLGARRGRGPAVAAAAPAVQPAQMKALQDSSNRPRSDSITVRSRLGTIVEIKR